MSERKLSKALNEFVLKDEKDAIPELVKYQLRKTQTELNKRNVDDEKTIDAEISSIKDAEDNIGEEEENEEIEKVFLFCFVFNPFPALGLRISYRNSTLTIVLDLAEHALSFKNSESPGT